METHVEVLSSILKACDLHDSSFLAQPLLFRAINSLLSSGNPEYVQMACALLIDYTRLQPQEDFTSFVPRAVTLCRSLNAQEILSPSHRATNTSPHTMQEFGLRLLLHLSPSLVARPERMERLIPDIADALFSAHESNSAVADLTLAALSTTPCSATLRVLVKAFFCLFDKLEWAPETDIFSVLATIIESSVLRCPMVHLLLRHASHIAASHVSLNSTGMLAPPAHGDDVWVVPSPPASQGSELAILLQQRRLQTLHSLMRVVGWLLEGLAPFSRSLARNLVGTGSAQVDAPLPGAGTGTGTDTDTQPKGLFSTGAGSSSGTMPGTVPGIDDDPPPRSLSSDGLNLGGAGTGGHCLVNATFRDDILRSLAVFEFCAMAFPSEHIPYESLPLPSSMDGFSNVERLDGFARAFEVYWGELVYGGDGQGRGVAFSASIPSKAIGGAVNAGAGGGTGAVNVGAGAGSGAGAVNAGAGAGAASLSVNSRHAKAQMVLSLVARTFRVTALLARDELPVGPGIGCVLPTMLAYLAEAQDALPGQGAAPSTTRSRHVGSGAAPVLVLLRALCLHAMNVVLSQNPESFCGLHGFLEPDTLPLNTFATGELCALLDSKDWAVVREVSYLLSSLLRPRARHGSRAWKGKLRGVGTGTGAGAGTGSGTGVGSGTTSAPSVRRSLVPPTAAATATAVVVPHAFSLQAPEQHCWMPLTALQCMLVRDAVMRGLLGVEVNCLLQVCLHAQCFVLYSALCSGVVSAIFALCSLRTFF